MAVVHKGACRGHRLAERRSASDTSLPSSSTTSAKLSRPFQAKVPELAGKLVGDETHRRPPGSWPWRQWAHPPSAADWRQPGSVAARMAATDTAGTADSVSWASWPASSAGERYTRDFWAEPSHRCGRPRVCQSHARALATRSPARACKTGNRTHELAHGGAGRSCRLAGLLARLVSGRAPLPHTGRLSHARTCASAKRNCRRRYSPSTSVPTDRSTCAPPTC